MAELVSGADQEFVQALRADGILHDVEACAEMDRFRSGIDLVFCGDIDFSWDKVQHLGGVFSRRIHRHALNGGALMLDPMFPPNRGWPLYILFRQDILDALHLKGIDAVVLMVHWPCSKAHAFGWGMRDVLRSLVSGKEFLNMQASEAAVLCTFHFCHRDDRLRTYAVDEFRLRERLGMPAPGARVPLEGEPTIKDELRIIKPNP